MSQVILLCLSDKKKTKSLNTAWIFLFRHLLHLLMWFDAIFYKRAKHEEIYGRLLGSYERFRHVLPKKAIRWNMRVHPSCINLNLLDEILLCSLERDMFWSIISLTTFFYSIKIIEIIAKTIGKSCCEQPASRHAILISGQIADWLIDSPQNPGRGKHRFSPHFSPSLFLSLFFSRTLDGHNDDAWKPVIAREFHLGRLHWRFYRAPRSS